MAVRTAGQGRPVLFIHGAGGDSHNWDGVVDRLKDRFTCLMVDRCGYGQSVWESDQPPSRQEHGAHLRQVVSTLDLGQPCAVGTSGGAITILAALLAAPNLLAGAVLVEPPLRIEDPGAPSTAPAPSADLHAGLEGDIIERGTASIRRLDAAAWDSMSSTNRQRYIDSFPTMFKETSQPPFIAARDQLGALTLPCAVVYGTATPERLAESSRALAKTLGAGTLIEVDGAAHLMYLTHTDEVAGLIGSFVEGCPAAPAAATDPA